MKTKVFGIRDQDFDEYIKKINDFSENHDVKATQTFRDNVGIYHAIIYYSEYENEKKPSKEYVKKGFGVGGFEPSLATEPQKKKMKQLKISFNEYTTKSEAQKLISDKLK